MNLCLLLPLFRIGKEGKFTVRGNRIQRFDINMIQPHGDPFSKLTVPENGGHHRCVKRFYSHKTFPVLYNVSYCPAPKTKQLF
jgi:hypothetical protein